MRRGDFVTVVLPRDYGKPRPALVVQSNLFDQLNSVALVPLTTHDLAEASEVRLDVAPGAENGLHEVSQIMIDKVTAIPVGKIGAVIGVADDALMLRVGRALAVFLGVV